MRVAKLARLMSGPSQYFEPLRLAETQETLAGQLDVSNLPRLVELLADQSGTVNFELKFSRSDNGTVRLTGAISTVVHLLCQRCLEPIAVRVNSPVSFAIQGTNGAGTAELPPDAEPLILNEQRVHLGTFLEDEILLGLPMVPMHAANACPASGGEAPAGQKRNRPFEVLKDLRTKS